jgi:regulator of sigma E protease
MLSKLPWLGPLIVFGLVVFVHELGHFLAAKAFGVYAPRFSIGFGTALLRKRFGETEYVLAALPLGGYVRMASRDDEATAFIEGGAEESTRRPEDDKSYDPNAMVPFGPKPVPEHRWFESKPLWQRLVIMLAGVTMNIILAVVVATALVKSEGRRITATRAIGAVDSVAWAPELQSRLTVGDTIVSVAGRPVATWNDVQLQIADAPDTLLVIRTQRADVSLPAGGPRSSRRLDLINALTPYLPPVIGKVVSGSPAARGGLRAGDSLVAVGGKPMHTWMDMTALISASPGTPVEFVVARDSGNVTLKVKPDSTPVRNPRSEKTTYRGMIGVQLQDRSLREPVGFAEAAQAGWVGTWASTGMVIGIVRDLLTGRVSVSQLGGPIAITTASVDAARDGATRLFEMLAFLSINLAVMNLLPIPILDGGQIVMNIAEAVKGSPFSVRTRENIMRVGLLAIGLLFVVVTFNDLRRLAGVARDLLTRVF